MTDTQLPQQVVPQSAAAPQSPPVASVGAPAQHAPAPQAAPATQVLQQTPAAHAPVQSAAPAQAPAPIARPQVNEPDWYKSIKSHLLFWAESGVSDVQMVSDANTWVVEKDKHVQTNLFLGRDHILALANYWQPANVGLMTKAGADVLQNEANGSLEVMASIDEWRARVIFRRQENGIGVTMRFIPPNAPELSSNPQPPQVLSLMNENNGLFIVSGPTGSGKTTLLATLLREYNTNHHKHLYTIEDPIEFLHRPINSLVSQREVGRDVDSFESGIKAAVRSKAQVILVGELRELEAIEAALDAANKGHLVFATTHASSAAQAVQSMVSSFPGDKQNLIRSRIAEVMKIIMVQRLVPRVDGRLMPVREIMLDHTTTTPRIQDGNFNELTSALKLENGMVSFEQSLFEAYSSGLITRKTAMDFANVKADLTFKIDRLHQRLQLPPDAQVIPPQIGQQLAGEIAATNSAQYAKLGYVETNQNGAAA